MAMEALEVEDPPRSVAVAAQRAASGAGSDKRLRLFACAVGGLLLAQVLLLAGLLARSSPGEPAQGKAGQPPPASWPPRRPVLEPPVIGPGGACLAGLHPQEAFQGFEAQHRAHRADFAVFWLHRERPADETFFEFPIALLSPTASASPLHLSVGAIFASGEYSHMDAMDGEAPVLKFVLSEDGLHVEIREPQLGLRMATREYRPLMEEHGREVLLASLPVLGVRVDPHCHRTHVLVAGDGLLASGVLTGAGYGPSQLDAGSVRAFPENLDFTIAHGRSPAVRFCLFRLPQEPLVGRVADDRVGYFDVPFRALGDYRGEAWPGRRPEEQFEPSVRLIQRQRLRRNPSSGRGEIVLHVDPTVPQAFREATKAGALRWNAAFQELGLGDVVRVLAPGDAGFPADYDTADVRFNSVSWAVGEDQEVFAIGQSVADPRTGEILKANIVFTLGWLAAWLGEALLFHSGFAEADLAGGKPWAERRLEQAAWRPRQEAARRGDAGARDVRGGAWPLEDARRELLAGWGLEREEQTPWRDVSLGMGAGRAFNGLHARGTRNASGSVFSKYCAHGGRSLRHRHPHGDVACRSLIDALPSLWLLVKERSEDEARAFLEEGIADVTSHEFGHTLGLRHNFQGSTALPFDESQNREYTGKHGLSSSVMDYIGSNTASQKLTSQSEAAQGGGRPQRPHYFTPVIGDYDKWAIRYGYTPIAGEKCCAKAPELDAIAAEYQHAAFTLATDEDLEVGGGIDPYTAQHDLTDDPLRWHLDRLQLVRETQEDILTRTLRGGGRFERLADAELRLLTTAFQALFNLNSFVGGLRISRRHAEQCEVGDCAKPEGGGPRPLEPVPWDRQMEALEGSLGVLAARSGQGPWPSSTLQGYCVAREDYLGLAPLDLAAYVDRLKVLVLQDLLHPVRLSNVLLAGRLLGKPKLLQSILRAISHALLGVAKDAAVPPASEAILTGVEDAVSDPEAWHVQLEYLALLRALAAEEANSKPGAEHGLVVALQGERLRLRAALGSIRREELQGFVSAASAYL